MSRNRTWSEALNEIEQTGKNSDDDDGFLPSPWNPSPPPPPSFLPPPVTQPLSPCAVATRELFPVPANLKISDKSLYSKVLAAIPRSSFDKMMLKMQVEQRQIDMESSETILEEIEILDSEQIMKRRQRDLVYEDNFNPTILDMAKDRVFSFQKLINVCSKYEGQRSLQEHIDKSRATVRFFIEKGLSEDDGLAVAFAIAFYTGSECAGDKGNQYHGINRASSVIARQSNGEAIANINHGDMKDSAVILYYLIRGLAHIPFYWGICSRAVQLTDEQLREYEPGALVSWFQFSSSMKGPNAPPYFVERSNTFFKIYSATGRGIQDFSIFSQEEEVLFLPHSTFLVLDHTISFDGKKHFINLRQMELGLSEYSVLWVDDHIFSEKWQSKEHMELAATRSLNTNVHFIPKSTTNFALSFLRSPFGQRLRNRVTFRIVTDMKRDNESSPDDAGIRLIKQIRKMGFRNECLIFCNYLPKVTEQVQTQLTPDERRHLTISNKTEDLHQFIQFQGI